MDGWATHDTSSQSNLPNLVCVCAAGFQQTEYRVIVTGLPPSASWQDLKDHMRKAGEPTYTDVVSENLAPSGVRRGVDVSRGNKRRRLVW